MKILKRALIIFVILIAVILLLGLVVKKEAYTEVSRVIPATPEAIFSKVNNLAAWEDWSPWREMDPEMKVTLGEKVAGEGAYYTWEGPITGKGKMTITKINAPESIETDTDFDGMGIAKGPWRFEKVDGGTKVTWGMGFDVPYPFNALNLISNPAKDIEKDFTRGLELLEKAVAKSAKSQIFRGYKVKPFEWAEKHYLGVRDVVAMKDYAKFYGENFGKAYGAIQEKGVNMAGMPCGLFYSWEEDSQTSDMAAAIPVEEKAEIEGLMSLSIPASKALLINYYGAYEAAIEAHFAMDDYMKANGLSAKMPVIEEYVTDPSQEPDTSKWLTRIYYLVDGK